MRLFPWKKNKTDDPANEPETPNPPDLQTVESAPEIEIEHPEALEVKPVKADAAETQPVEATPVHAAPPVEVELPDAQPEEEKPAKTGLFGRLRQRLGKTKTGLVDRVKQVVQLHGKVDEELLEEIEMILVQADVGIETTTRIVERLRKDSEAKKTESPDALIDVFKTAIQDIVSHDERLIELRSEPPTVILVIGVNGVGKTTTIGKLAQEFADCGKKVMLVAGDTFRAAAIEQLTIWAERTGSTIVKQTMGADPGSVCYDALASPEAREHDVILIDTAGRLHTKSNLMEELRKIDRVIKKVIPDAPHESLLILDATTGQNALSQAKLFSETVNLTGLIMTKLDGTAKGGILIALRDLFDIPVLKIGIGEGVEDLRDFDPKAYVDALFAD